MKKYISALAIVSVFTFGSLAVVACSSDDSGTPTGTSSGNPLNPGSDSGTSGSSGTSGTSGSSGADGGCPSTPAGCFCGTPTTQAQFLNRCTTAVSLPVSVGTYTPATTADIP